jgi:hypothetical protein
MFWGQALIEFRRTSEARSWPNFRAWHLRTDSKSAFATSLVGSRSPPSTTSFGISAFDMWRGTRPPTLPMSSRMHHFPNRRPSDLRNAHRYQRGRRRKQHARGPLPLTRLLASRQTPLTHPANASHWRSPSARVIFTRPLWLFHCTPESTKFVEGEPRMAYGCSAN